MTRGKSNSSGMVRITVSIPKQYAELMDLLVSEKLYYSRGEIVKSALRELLMREAGPNGEAIIKLRKNIASQ